MPLATRQGDSTSGICFIGCKRCPHGRHGTNSTCSPNVRVNFRGVHRFGDIGSCHCPHGGSFISTRASKTVKANFLGITRLGDRTSCMSCGQSGAHTSGSSNVIIGA